MKTYIRIADWEMFEAEYLEGTGMHYGLSEHTKPNDPVRGFIPETCVARAHYLYNHEGQMLEDDHWYRHCEWETIDDNDILFHVWEPLTYKKA